MVGPPALHAGPRVTTKGVRMQAEAHPKKRTGLTIGAWVAVVFGAVVVAAGGTGNWGDTWERGGNGHFSPDSHRYHTPTPAGGAQSIKGRSHGPSWLPGNNPPDAS